MSTLNSGGWKSEKNILLNLACERKDCILQSGYTAWRAATFSEREELPALQHSYQQLHSFK